MLNTAPLNTSELNAPGFSAEVVELGGVGAVVVTSVLPSIETLAGLGAAGAVAVTASAALLRTRRASATAHAVVTGSAVLDVAKALQSSSPVVVGGVLGLSLPQEMAAAVDVNVVGILYPQAILFSAATVAVTQASNLSKIEALAGAGAVAVTQVGSIDVSKPLAAATDVVVSGIADPDAEVGGVLVVGLSGRPSVNVTAAAAIDPTLTLGGSGAVVAAGGAAVATITFGLFSTVPVVVTDNAELQVFTGGIASSVPVNVTPSANLQKDARFQPAAAAVAVTGNVRLGIVTTLEAMASINVTYAAASTRRSGMRTVSPVVVTGALPEIILGARLAAVASVDVTGAAAPIYYVRKNLSTLAEVNVISVAAPVYFTRRNLQVNATVRVDGALIPRAILSLAGLSPVAVSATATLRTNLFSAEPDYRTVAVEADIDTLLVDAQEFTLIVTTDLVPMQTFTKQPTEILPYDIDFQVWIEGITGSDEIESATCTVVTASSGLTTALTIDSVLLVTDTHRVKVWVSGGTNGVTYKLTLVMLTAAGRRKEVDFRVKIKET